MITATICSWKWSVLYFWLFSLTPGSDLDDYVYFGWKQAFSSHFRLRQADFRLVCVLIVTFNQFQFEHGYNPPTHFRMLFGLLNWSINVDGPLVFPHRCCHSYYPLPPICPKFVAAEGAQSLQIRAHHFVGEWIYSCLPRTWKTSKVSWGCFSGGLVIIEQRWKILGGRILALFRDGIPKMSHLYRSGTIPRPRKVDWQLVRNNCQYSRQGPTTVYYTTTFLKKKMPETLNTVSG